MTNECLLVAGVFELILGLILAWMMVLYSHYGWSVAKRTFASYRDLVKAHLDYLLMALFNLAFFSVAQVHDVELSPIIIFLTIYGSFVNPLGFLLPSISPKLDELPKTSIYKLFIFSSFLATSIGFAGTGISLVLN